MDCLILGAELDSKNDCRPEVPFQVCGYEAQQIREETDPKKELYGLKRWFCTVSSPQVVAYEAGCPLWLL